MKKAAMALICAAASVGAYASSHREAPFIAGMPRVDGTDFYMFNSYESGRAGQVTIIANYVPLQDSYGGPNYFAMDPEALYEIHIDNNGDSKEDLTFQFRFTNTYKGIAVPTGAAANVAIPLVNIGGTGPGVTDNTNLNVTETYTVTLIRGDRRSGTAFPVTKATGGSATFEKPVDNIGNKSIPDYATYAGNHIFAAAIPGCVGDAKVFVGQRKEGFVVNLGQVFDLINLNPLAPRPAPGGGNNIIDDKNVTSLALELPASCLTAGADPVVGGWTTASLRQSRVLNPTPGTIGVAGKKGPAVTGGAWTQVSRLGSPLVNEVVIGIIDKDRFNASQPKDDLAAFGTYVTNPTLPVLVDALFFPTAGIAPATPRNDLVAAFVTGITTGASANPDLNAVKFTAPANLTVPGEMLRLNTAIPAAAIADQQDLGFLACDLSGFPNGRRPIDDVVDIELTVVEGALTRTEAGGVTNGVQTCDISGATPVIVNPGTVVNDGATPTKSAYLTTFPYLNTPLPGSP